MPEVFTFPAVQYASGVRAGSADVSSLIAPPYDVLDAPAKTRLVARDARNVTVLDLPHLPAKELGPPEAYRQAGDTFRAWLRDRTLVHAERPSMFAYRETFASEGRTLRRTGMACTVATVPFGPRSGGGILPHEETFSGPKEDRLALMRATRAQLSPIFGLHADAGGAAARVLSEICSARNPDMRAQMDDGVLHEVWRVEDEPTISRYRAALAGEDVYIADGHHRYTTALNYLQSVECAGTLANDHPARRCMMVLVSMSDPGLAIWPTHRVLAGMQNYTWERLTRAASECFEIEPVPGGPSAVARRLSRETNAVGRLGLFDFATGAGALIRTRDSDPLQSDFPDKPAAWRSLDVAIVQHLLVERVCRPVLNNGHPIRWAFPHTIPEVESIGRGEQTGAGGGAAFGAQLAVLVRPTPLESVREISRAGVLMPQKSTFFYPKLATGLFMHALD